VTNGRIVALGLLTQNELQLLGAGFNRAWPVDESPCFQGLLEAIDDADRVLWRARDGEVKNAATSRPRVATTTTP
jgi:hypothetical protein